jgi:hypothetical protein
MGYFKNQEVELQGEYELAVPASMHVAYDAEPVPYLRRRSYAHVGWALIGLALGVAVGVWI